MIGDVAKLTRRQRECLRLVPELGTSKRIADRMGLEPASVDKTIYRAMRILQVSSRAEAAAMLLSSEAAQSIILDTPAPQQPVSMTRPVGNRDADDAYPVRPETVPTVVEEERQPFGLRPPSILQVVHRFLFEPGAPNDLTLGNKLRGVFIWFLFGVIGVSMLAAAISEVTRTFHDLAVHGLRP